MIKQAVILAAGRGRRMKEGQVDKPLLDTPKPLLEVRGTPIIERTLKKLAECGVRTAIVINQKDEKKFRDKLAKYDIEYCYQESPLGTANALYCARDFVKDELFLVLMGDDISNIDIENLIKIESPTVFGFEVEEVGEFGALLVDTNGLVTDILEKKVVGKGIANTGIYIMPKKFFCVYGQVPKDAFSGEYYLTHAIRILREANIPLHFKRLDYWKGINTPNDLKRANEINIESMTIRKARLSDLPSLLGLLHQLSPIEDIKVEKGREEMREILNRVLINEDYYLMVGEIAGEIVATATLLIQANLSHKGRSYGHIENVITDEKFRNNSIGRRMIEHLVETATTRNCYKVILDCSEQNAHFYEKSGFKRSSEIEMRIDLE